MKLKAMQTYQSVRFQGKQETYFDISAVHREGKLSLTLEKECRYITVETDKDEIVIFTANVAYVVPEQSKGPADLQKRGQLTDIDHTKAPKAK